MVKQNQVKKEKEPQTMMRVTRRLIKYLKENAVYGDSLEDVIWRMIGKKNEQL